MTSTEKIEKEKVLVEVMKTILDPNANFVKPLSEFWRGCTAKQTSSYGLYGLWLSGEGGSCINGERVADYYDYKKFDGGPGLKAFCKTHKLTFEWYDAGTIMLII